MECREFREIADSYMNDELLVETNHNIHRHLENCRDCREVITELRRLRSRLASVVGNAEEFMIDPHFADRLTRDLRRTALENSGWHWLFARSFLLPVGAGLIIIVGFAFVPRYIAPPSDVVSSRSDLTNVKFLAAAETHRDCAVKKLAYFVSIAQKESPIKSSYRERILEPLQAKLGADLELLDVHDCLYEGRLTTHVVLRRKASTISVIFDRSQKTGEFPANGILARLEAGFHIAAIDGRDQTTFVVSDMPEDENTSAAQALALALNNGI